MVVGILSDGEVEMAFLEGLRVHLGSEQLILFNFFLGVCLHHGWEKGQLNLTFSTFNLTI